MQTEARRSAGPGRALIAYVGALVVVDLALSTAITPLLPHYVRTAGLSTSGAGILMGSYPLGSITGALPGGFLAGRLGPRAAVLAGLAAEATAGLAFGWSSTGLALAAVRFFQGAAGACVWAGGLAWLAGATPAARRGEVLGVAMGFAAAGTLAGPAVGALAIWAGPVLAFSVIAAVNVVLMATAGFLPRPAEAGGQHLLPRPRVLRDRGIAAGIFLTMIGGVAIGMLDVLAPLRLSQLGATALVIAGTFFAAGVGETLLSPLVGRLSDRRGAAAAARRLLVAGGAVSMAFPLLGRAGWVVALLALGMPAFGSLCVPGSALLSAGAERLRLYQGVAFGLGNCAWSGGEFAAAAAGGGVAQATSDMVPGVLFAGLCLITVIALRRHARHARSRSWPGAWPQLMRTHQPPCHARGPSRVAGPAIRRPGLPSQRPAAHSTSDGPAAA
jgi:MFS family permease